MPKIPDLTTTTAAADAAVKPSLAEQLIVFGREAWVQILRLDAREAGINLLLSATVVLIAGGLIWPLRRMFDVAAAVET